MFSRLSSPSTIFKFRRGNRSNEESAAEPDTVATLSDEEADDHEWDRPLEFLFSLISNSVGLGNVWRFPYLAAKNGGGTFLIPYFIIYLCIGAPIYYLELALGQFCSRGPATAFTLAKGWRGVGFAMIINSVFCMLYYNVIISWALFYFVASFRKNLLWTQCGYWWNDKKCFVPGSGNAPYKENNTIFNCTELQFQNQTYYGCSKINSSDVATATEQFFYNLLLGKSRSFEDFGSPQLFPALSLLAAWILVGLCIFRGVKSSGKVAYFTAIFPYLVLLILIIQSATLPGAVDGVKFYIIPRWELVGRFETWQAAASQVFFSLGLSFGSLIAYSASNKFNNNFFKQMCIVVSCDCFTGVFAGFAVFATIGFLARESKGTVEAYADSSGPGLAFITYPEGISHMPASPFFSVIFFLMLFALGLGSQLALTDVPITSITELFPRFRSRRIHAVVITCVLSYLISLPFTCPGGIYLFELLNQYAANISMVVVGFFEVYTVAYIYGFNRFMNDVKMMLGKRAAQYYLFVTWCIIAPPLMLIIICSNLLGTKPMENGASGGYEKYTYPQWSTILGWFIFVACIIPIPLVYLINYIKEYQSIAVKERSQAADPKSEDSLPDSTDYYSKPRYLQAITENNSPRSDWGPKKDINRYGLYTALNSSKETERPDFSGASRARSTAGFFNQTFQDDQLFRRSVSNHYETRF